MSRTQVAGVGTVQCSLVLLRAPRASRAVRLGCAHRGWPLALLFKHQLKLELSLIPARAWRGPHCPPPDKDRIQLDECVSLASKVAPELRYSL